MKSYKKPVLAIILKEPRDIICLNISNGNDDFTADPFSFGDTENNAEGGI